MISLSEFIKLISRESSIRIKKHGFSFFLKFFLIKNNFLIVNQNYLEGRTHSETKIIAWDLFYCKEYSLEVISLICGFNFAPPSSYKNLISTVMMTSALLIIFAALQFTFSRNLIKLFMGNTRLFYLVQLSRSISQ